MAALPVSIGDLVMAGTLAYKLCQQCMGAPEEYRELGDLCSEIHLVIQTCRPNDPRTVLRNQDAYNLEKLVASLKSTLEKLSDLLDRLNTEGTLQGAFNKLKFVGAKDERERLRKRLNEHVSFISAINTGATLKNLEDLSKLLLPRFIERSPMSPDVDGAGEKRMTKLMDEAFKEYEAQDTVEFPITTELRDAVRKVVLREIEESKFERTTTTEPEDIDVPKHEPESSPATTPGIKQPTFVFRPLKPAEFASRRYQPLDFEWFEGGGWKLLRPLPVNHLASDCRFEEAVIRYSQEDEHLSKLPCGWSATPTVANRGSHAHCSAYFWVYNNLSCSPNNLPMCSRLYYYDFPFFTNLVDIAQEQNLPAGWEMRIHPAGSKYYIDHSSRTTTWHHPIAGFVDQDRTRFFFNIKARPSPTIDDHATLGTGEHGISQESRSHVQHDDATSSEVTFQAIAKMWPNKQDPSMTFDTPAFSPSQISPDSRSIPCAGFVSVDNVCLDLGDKISRRLAERMYGSDGNHTRLFTKELEDSLPNNWMYEFEDEQTHHCKYADSSSGSVTTVHPSYFWSTADEEPNILPPGWDRRLDTWGNLFFVDHHTQSAVREDPRFNPNIDRDTGLPAGWQAFELMDGTRFYFTQTPHMVIGTYDPSTMTSRSLKHKNYYARAPKSGEDPKNLLKLGHRSGTQKPKSIAKPAVMSASEKEAYYKLFSKAAKTRHSVVTIEEAQLQCSEFQVPSTEIEQILRLHDSNRDGLWNVDEYSHVLHAIKLRVQDPTNDKHGRPLTPEHRQKYYAQFESVKSSASPVMTREEVIASCVDTGLAIGNPDDFVSAIIDHADYNKDQRWNVDEFAEVMHRIAQEVGRREALRMLGSPVDPTPLTAKQLPLEGDGHIADTNTVAGAKHVGSL